MFENTSSRILPLPYPSLSNYGGSYGISAPITGSSGSASNSDSESGYTSSSTSIPSRVPNHIQTMRIPMQSYHLPPIHVPRVKSEGEINSIPSPPSAHLMATHTSISPVSQHEENDRTDFFAMTAPIVTMNKNPTASPIRHHHLRKKRQCPDCKLYFSNLATHKSTHLSVNSRPFICDKCSRGFARSNDLIRHQNSHLKEVGQFLYKCPFYQGACHSSGCFSRCDTFKNHLKALHFQYPSGTKKKDRSRVNGECKLCGAWFANVDEWLKLHIEPHNCEKMLA